MSFAISQGTLTQLEVIKVPQRAVVHEHHQSKAKYTVFPFAFSDGYPGTIVVTKGVKSRWIPFEDIEEIIIKLK